MDDERQPLLNISTGSSRASSLRSTPDSSLVPAEPPRWKTNFSFILVLVTETLERLAFYGLICNLVPALNSYPLLWTSYDAVGAIFIMNGISYIMTLFGGWIADSFLGKISYHRDFLSCLHRWFRHLAIPVLSTKRELGLQ